MKKVLAVNSGSSSLKFKLFSVPDEKILAMGKGDSIGLANASFTVKLANGEKHVQKIAIPNHEFAVQLLLKALQNYHLLKDFHEIVGVGHRIVAGGEDFTESTIIDAKKLRKIYDLIPYAPLHNKPEADGIKAFMKLLPDVPQIGVFDTSFHQTLDEVHYLYSLPYEYYQKYKVRKYGAHGTSVRYVMQRTAKLLHKKPQDLKMIVCHLGSGSSITAIKYGKSYDTSMGFSPVSGITMSTRSGDVDPSLLQFIMNHEHISMDQMISILNTKSGILGISGVSQDMRLIKHNNSRRCRLAREIFVNRVVRYLGAYITELAGVDVIVFTAGIGEQYPEMRASVMKAFAYMGVKPDLAANQTNGEKTITKPDSSIRFMVVPTDEELMIARDVVRLAKLK